MPAGRPITWTDEKKAEACEKILGQISITQLGLDSICDADETLPDPATFHDWKRHDKELDEKYIRAREQQAVYLTDCAGVYAHLLVSPNPSYALEPQAFMAWLKAQQWRTEKLAPRTHGNKITQEQTGKDGGPIATASTISLNFVEPK